VLYFRSVGDGTVRLVAWDLVTQFPETASLQIERHLASEVLAASPTPTPSETPIQTVSP
jgi:hypothetical protein